MLLSSLLLGNTWRHIFYIVWLPGWWYLFCPVKANGSNCILAKLRKRGLKFLVFPQHSLIMAILIIVLLNRTIRVIFDHLRSLTSKSLLPEKWQILPFASKLGWSFQSAVSDIWYLIWYCQSVSNVAEGVLGFGSHFTCLTLYNLWLDSIKGKLAKTFWKHMLIWRQRAVSVSSCWGRRQYLKKLLLFACFTVCWGTDTAIYHPQYLEIGGGWEDRDHTQNRTDTAE